jgi:hypothetical protein
MNPLWMPMAVVIAAVTPGTSIAPPPYASALPTVPGMDNPLVTQATLSTTICSKAKSKGGTWIHNQRPPTSYTNKIKQNLMASLHLPGKISDYELDHEESIEDGGSPTSLQNLWMQPYAGTFGARVKTKISHLICAGKITLDAGRTALKTDWVAAHLKYVGPIKGYTP